MWQCPKCKRRFEAKEHRHSCKEMPSSIDAYIAAQPEEIQPILIKVRETIRAAAPEAVEKISWRMPTFWQGENLIHFAAFQKHIGIYPGEISRLPFEEQLSGYNKTKGAIHFPLQEPVDYGLIGELTRYRVRSVQNRRRL